ncbi:MAG: type II toxin-antitoxin system RelE/ParE family toxin [Oscillospiraceae bacterium]|nr:type II toxin-antitoxin system RelE/ParE family toxin [Oscillospiraceae bacterium]
MRKIYTYQNVQNFIESDDEKLKDKFQNILAYISNEKNELREPYVRHISQNRFKGLYEIRLKASRTMARVVFSKQDENIILLYAFYKNDIKDTKRALGYALKLLNEARKK